MLSFRRKSALPSGAKNEAAPPPPAAAIAEAKEAESDDDSGDIFSAVLSSARTSQQLPTRQPPADAARPDLLSKEKLQDEEKDGKLSVPPPPASEERAFNPPPALPSLSKPEFTPDALRALTAVHAVDKEGPAEGSKDDVDQHHERKTSSSALIAGILNSNGITSSSASATVASIAPAASPKLSPPRLLSGASMTIESQPRRELPRISMRDIHGDAEPPTIVAPPPTPAAASAAPSRSPPPTPQRALPSPAATPPTAPPAAPALSIAPLTTTASIATNARLVPVPPTPTPRSPPPRPTPPPQPHTDEGVPNPPPAPFSPAAASVPNPFDDGAEEVEGQADEKEGAVYRGVVGGARPTVVAVAAYTASAADQVSCVKGEVLEVVDDSHASWCMVRSAQGRQGLVPASYVRKQRREEEGSSPAIVAAMPLPAPRQPSYVSHRRTASQPPSVPSHPSVSCVAAPPSPQLRLPPPSPTTPSAPSALRLQPPSPASHAAPPPLPRPVSTAPCSPGGPAPPSPTASPSPPAHPARPRVLSHPPSTPVARDHAAPAAAEVAGAAVDVCEAAHVYSALAADQLSMAAGEKLLLLDRNHPHWWKVVNGAGQTGLVPTTYIKPAAATQPAVRSPPSVPVSAVEQPPPVLRVRSPPPPQPPAPRPPPAIAPPAQSQPPVPPPLSIPHPARQIQLQVATTPTAASATAVAAPPQHRHSMSLNTISAPIKPALPASAAAAAAAASSAPATPSGARAAAVEQPSFPTPPTPAARAAPPPSPSPRPYLSTTPTAAPPTAAAVPASGGLVQAKVAERGEAVHSFEAADGVQLSVCKGDALMIVGRLETGWTVCRLLHTGITGLVPTSYIRSTG